MTTDDALTYFMDGTDRVRLKRIMTRLYDDRPLSGDQRRDLANAIFGIIENLSPYKDEPA
jgi:hypothetical protein